MKNSIKLSIIVPVYKTEQYLRKCLSSILDQEVDKSLYEVIIVNDGSPDNSQMIIDEYCATHDNISCIVQNNHGQSVARNKGIDIAKGEYIWYVDSDDWVDKKSIQIIMSEMSTDPDVIMITRFGCSPYDHKDTPYSTSGSDILFTKVFEQGPVFYVMRNQFIKNYDLYFVPGIYHEDSEIIPRFLYLAKSVRVIPTPLYYVYENPTSTTRSINPKKSYDLLIVSENLCKFKHDHISDDKTKKVFDHLISVDLNNALNNIIKCDRAEQRRFNLQMYKKRHLLSVLWNSPLKYRIEYILFRLFPKHTVEIYRVMKRK